MHNRRTMPDFACCGCEREIGLALIIDFRILLYPGNMQERGHTSVPESGASCTGIQRIIIRSHKDIEDGKRNQCLVSTSAIVKSHKDIEDVKRNQCFVSTSATFSHLISEFAMLRNDKLNRHKMCYGTAEWLVHCIAVYV